MRGFGFGRARQARRSHGIGVPTTPTPTPAPMLPTFATAPAAIYAMRKVVAGYAGAAIRVRRGSDNAEQDVGFDGNGLPDTAAALAWAGASSAYVTRWYDQSGNGRDATQSNAAAQPLIVASWPGEIVFDGQRVGSFGGGVRSKSLLLPTGLSVMSNAMTVFGVLSPTVSLNDEVLWEIGGGAQGSSIVFNQGGDQPRLQLSAGGGVFATAAGQVQRAGARNVIGQVSGVSGKTAWVNGAVSTGSASPAASYTGGNLGAFVLANGAVADTYAGSYDYAVFVAYPAALSEADAATLNGALQTLFATEPARAYRVVLDGDSITEGYYTTQNRNIARLLADQMPAAEFFNLGITDRTLASMTAAAASNVLPLYAPARTRNIALIMGGINDSGATSATVGRGAAIRSYCATVRAAGFKVIVGTLTPCGSTYPAIQGDDANRQAYNTDLRANWSSFADGIADFDANVNLRDIGNVGYYVDTLHPADAGHAIRATIAKTAIEAVL